MSSNQNRPNIILGITGSVATVKEGDFIFNHL